MSKVVGLPDNGDKLEVALLMTKEEADHLRVFIGSQASTCIAAILNVNFKKERVTPLYPALDKFLVNQLGIHNRRVL